MLLVSEGSWFQSLWRALICFSFTLTLFLQKEEDGNAGSVEEQSAGLQYLWESFVSTGDGVAFHLVPWRMREKWEGGSNSVGFIEKTVQVVADSTYSLLSREMTMVRKRRFWQQVVDGTRLAGEQENRNPVWPLPNLFVNVYIYICSWIVASSSVSCHWGALWHHSASIYSIFSTFGYRVHFFSYASKI